MITKQGKTMSRISYFDRALAQTLRKLLSMKGMMKGRIPEKEVFEEISESVKKLVPYGATVVIIPFSLQGIPPVAMREFYESGLLFTVKGEPFMYEESEEGSVLVEHSS